MSELSDLLELGKRDPAAAAKLLAGDVALRQRIAEELKNDVEMAKRIIAQDDKLRAGEEVSAGGFATWYEEQYQREFPYVFGPVAEEFAWAYHNRKGVILEGWRGLGKSTFFAAWCPYVMGVNPVGSTALIRINDAKAKEMGKTISDIVMTSLAWKRMFSHVVPDDRAGWSVENGFEVMDTRVTGVPGSKDFESNYAKWRMMCLANHLSEKSLLCSGVESGSNIGLHPTNGAWFDDLHDEQNTKSITEMKNTTDIVKGNIIPTWFSAGGAPTLGVFCTPWSKNPPDAYEVMMNTGLFKKISIPIFKLDEDGEEIPKETSDGKPIDSEWAGRKVKPTWRENFPVQRIADIIKANGTRFGQMYLLDVELSKPKNMRYQQFPQEQIVWNEWMQTVGVDPVATVKGVSTGEGISHFAAVQLLKTPYNTVVIGDAIVERCDALEGEKIIANLQRTYARTYQNASVELNGAGAMFVAMVTRTKGLKIHGHAVGELGTGNKKDRQYRFLQPLMASGTVLISTADTPGLNLVREYFDVFPNFENDSPLADVGDAICIGVLDIPEVWTKIVTDNATPDIWTMKKKKADPYVALLEGRR